MRKAPSSRLDDPEDARLRRIAVAELASEKGLELSVADNLLARARQLGGCERPPVGKLELRPPELGDDLAPEVEQRVAWSDRD